MRFCTGCGKVIGDNENMCENCFKKTRTKIGKIVFPVIIVLVLAFSAIIYVFSSNYLHQKAFDARISRAERLADEVTGKAQQYSENRLNSEISKGKKGIPTLGMTTAQVRYTSWGEPNDVNKTTNRYGIREQWVYGNGRYLYFEDDILVSIQE